MLKIIHKFIILLCLFFIAEAAKSQISSSVADYTKYTDSVAYPGTDPIFIFYQVPGQAVSGSLIAKGPVSGSFNFEWSEYNADSETWDQLQPIDMNVQQSQREGLSSGGYQVRVNNGSGIDTSFIAWVFIDKLTGGIEKTEDNRIKPFKYTCDFLTLNGSVILDNFVYYNPVNNNPVNLKNGFTFLWTSDNTDLIIPNSSRVLDPNITYRPPVKDTWYILTVTDSMDMKVVDSVFYETIHTRAEFSYLFFDKEDTKEFINPPSPPQSDAPLKVRFINESQNGASFEWIFIDSLVAGTAKNEFTKDSTYQPEYTYLVPGSYYPMLASTSTEGCVDTFKITIPLKVIPSELKVSNVFSPNGDGINDYFTVSHKSIKTFIIRIYSRTGNLVYKNDITELYDWEGWDGKIMNSERAASPGVYYYIIEAEGYDDEKYRKGIYRSTIHLFR